MKRVACVMVAPAKVSLGCSRADAPAAVPEPVHFFPFCRVETALALIFFSLVRPSLFYGRSCHDRRP
jgi:hypothetical protein